MTAADQYRRQIRADLHAKRCRDKDHSELRLWQDARTLDLLMTRKGFVVTVPTSWGTSPSETARSKARQRPVKARHSPGLHEDDD